MRAVILRKDLIQIKNKDVYVKAAIKHLSKRQSVDYYPHNYKELAVRMFCEGMTMMAIARVLKVPYQIVRTCYTFSMLKS